MSSLTIEEVKQLMENQKNIRNVTIISSVNHGKATLTNVLSSKAEIIIAGKEAQREKYTHTSKSAGLQLRYKYDAQNLEKKELSGQNYLMNLVHSPNNPDLSRQTITTLRIVDGALLLVDAVEGVSMQTETLLRYALQEKVKSVLVLNKVDKAIVGQNFDGEAIYQSFAHVIQKTNDVLATFQFKEMGNNIFDPAVGNVAFESGKDEWGFTLNRFAKMYAKKFELSEEAMLKKLWGDHFYDETDKKWKTEGLNENKQPLKRAFVQLIMDPICRLYQSILNGKKEEYLPLIEKLGIELTQQDKTLTQEKLVNVVMSKWLPAADSILDMVVLHLPSPMQAQSYRTEYLYEGPMSDECAISMRKCDPQGPLMIYISKMIKSTTNKGRFYGFGRVFSGTVVGAGKEVTIMGPNYKQGSKNDIFKGRIHSTYLMMGQSAVSISHASCGNIVAILGVDQYLINAGTIGQSNHVSSSLRVMKYSTSPLIKFYVQPKNPDNLHQVLDGIRNLSKSDPTLFEGLEDTGSIFIGSISELYLQKGLKELQKQYQIIPSDPCVVYRETITEKSTREAMAKSQNKHNRLYGNCEQLDQILVDQIESGAIFNEEPSQRTKILIQQFGWDKDDTKKIWNFQPGNGANILVDMTKGVPYMNQLKDSMIQSFKQVSQSGVLCQELMKGIRFNIVDCQLHSDAMHRGGGQIIPAAKRLYYALEILGRPTLMEPIYLNQITAPIDFMDTVYQILKRRKATKIVENKIGHSLIEIKSYLPISQSFGINEELRQKTKGNAAQINLFDHWDKIPGLPMEDKNAEELIMKIRKIKGLDLRLPQLYMYEDKIN